MGTESDSKFQEVIDAILDVGGFELLANVDRFNKKGDGIEFRYVEDRGVNYSPYDTYLRGRSTNPEVGDDLWSVDWIVTSLESHRLTSGDTSADREIVDLYDEFNDLFSEEDNEDSDD